MTFGDIYRWSEDHDFLVMFVCREDGGDGWLGPVLANPSDPKYVVGEWDEWVAQGVTEPVATGYVLYWEKVR